MKILSGPTNDDWVWTMSVTCKTCGSVLELEKGDVDCTGSGSNNLTWEFYFGYRCPICEELGSLDKTWLPQYVMDDALKGIARPR